MNSENLKTLIRDAVTEEYEKLRNESRTYGEFRVKCERYCKEIEYTEKNLGLYVREKFEKMMEYEIGKEEIKCE